MHAVPVPVACIVAQLTQSILTQITAGYLSLSLAISLPLTKLWFLVRFLAGERHRSPKSSSSQIHQHASYNPESCTGHQMPTTHPPASLPHSPTHTYTKHTSSAGTKQFNQPLVFISACPQGYQGSALRCGTRLSGSRKVVLHSQPNGMWSTGKVCNVRLSA